MIVIDPSARVSPLADIEDSVRGTRIEVRKGAVIDAFVKIKPAGGSGDVIVGEDSVINSGCVIYTGNGVRIGKGVAIAANCTFAPVNHEFSRRDVPIRAQGFRPSKGGIEIGDEPGDMRQPGTRAERGSALVVDKHEGDVGGRVTGCQTGDERLQELRLAGSGRPGDQRVWAVVD